MYGTVSKNIKKKRKEVSNYKKWTEYEIKLLLEYMQGQEEIEKPTAQIFYRNFLKASGIDASWDLCRWKVKHLKSCYLKTLNMQKSDGADIPEAERKVCRFYDELHSIFGPKYSQCSYEITETVIKNELELNNTTTGNEFNGNGQNEFNANDQNEFIGFENVDDFRSTPVIETRAVSAKDDCTERQSSSSASQPSTSPPRSSYLPSNFPEKPISAGVKRADHKPRNSLDQLYFMQSERNAFLKLKIDFEKEKFKKEFGLKERQFEELIKERKENFELKKLEMEKEERIRILEIEKQERVERFEIEMRYKHA